MSPSYCVNCGTSFKSWETNDDKIEHVVDCIQDSAAKYGEVKEHEQ